MRKILVIVLALAGMQLSAQDSKINKESSFEQSNSIIDKLAADQVVMLSKKLNLTKPQQKLTTDLIIKQLKSDKFQKIMATKHDDNQSEVINRTLLEVPEFILQLTELLSEEQTQVLYKISAR
ncbi:hypothetical protein BZARG_1595 [Bizionia argentinensis JUB59]|uniref:DUF4168 domain-containing protein n=1 Tax=Bizionia argentinensis JUB59 TaxID=1046627 RepID=G2EA89_9FLAO|nr:hypothetical protein [Bizionia argentinensis]EGV44703.1 hypothetical protein BZARG_1595 [Bizionia argentinensis JUB59]